MTALPYQPVQLTPTLSIHGPLTRRGGQGPGLLIIQDVTTEPHTRSLRPTLDPEPLQKWAEEGYCVARIELPDGHVLTEQELEQAVQALETHENCAANALGLIVYSEPAIPAVLNAMDPEKGCLGISDLIKAVVSYGPMKLVQPHLSHLAGHGEKSTSDNETTHWYPAAQCASFVISSHPDYHPPSAAVAHSRSLEFLKKRLGGPWFDLEAIWDEHTRLEFAERAVEETMNTMVQEPYVNHVPTMTGGIGRKNLTSFYAKHFIFSNPDDTELQLISRTVGVDRVVDEFIFSLTHDRVIDWL